MAKCKTCKKPMHPDDTVCPSCFDQNPVPPSFLLKIIKHPIVIGFILFAAYKLVGILIH